MSLTGSCLGDVAAAAAFVATLLVIACGWFYGYWERRGVPSLETESIFGNCKAMLLYRKHFGEGVLELYRRLDPHPYGGIFISLRPMLVVRDPELIKSCLLKDFGHFQHRGLKVDEEHDPLSAHLFNLGGPRWRALRTKLTPTFTSGKMKLMFPLMEACARDMVAALQPLADRGEDVEMKEWNARFTTDVIGTCAFGIQCNSLRDPESEFRRMGRGLFTSPIRNLFNFVLVRIGYLLRIKFLSPEHERFFMGVVRETVEYRKKNGVVRNDFVNLLLQLQEKGHVDPDHESPDQGKNVSHSPDTDLKTLRKYPPLTELDRICTVAYTIPGSDVKIEEGTKLIIPVYAIHHDPKYYPDPEKFDPERFTEERKASRHHFVYLPFGEGPRICIGMRFGLIQTKLGIASLVSKFVFSATSKTPAKLQMDPKAAVASALGGINVRITART
ncbi:probable cytochrome P450 6a14 isoform X2 [Schistocerca cancellata]|uniref:probable cytochrome P450 6a14 isoform X2 n=1 Tax=Schistocerca cancellata TaxID=274614 RepID=UPI002117429E|nr:probable cytochrome P450 6a14 isoform X2 [Schistocerca cancellata]